MDKAFKGIYKRRKIFITGHTGFKGGWLALWLKVLGAEVLGYSLEPPTVPSFFEAVDLESLVDHHIIGDVRDGEKLASVMREFKPEFVFHLAAQPLVRPSYKNPRLTYETNVLGTVNLFEAVRNTDTVKVVINITSDKCYENKEMDTGKLTLWEDTILTAQARAVRNWSRLLTGIPSSARTVWPFPQ